MVSLLKRIRAEFYVFAIIAFYILLNTVVTLKGNMLVNLLPIALIVVVVALASIRTLLYIIVFFTPLSVLLSVLFPQLSFDMALPTEPLLVGVLLLFIYKLFIQKKFDRRIVNHPVSLAIYFSIAWMFLTCITSTMPVVSIKFLLSRVWFLVSFYFIATAIFNQKAEMKKYVWLYIFSMSIVMIYAIVHQLKVGIFDKDVAHRGMQPFFKDHTGYAAAIAFYIPMLVGFTFRSNYRFFIRLLSFAFLALYTIALALSFTRAAWLSIFFAIGICGIVFLRIKLRTVLLSLATLLILFFTFKNQIFVSLERNKTDSSVDFSKHLQSMSNIKSDASNRERINRWNCALRMFEEKPIMGWGPGTYMFKYAPFQVRSEKTIISTNAGTGGNAHSEYLGPLAESGVLGMLSYVLVLCVVIYYGIKVYYHSKEKEFKMLAMACIAGISTYIFHGVLNDFLDSDKISAPFWGFIAIIVAIDIYHLPKQLNTEK